MIFIQRNYGNNKIKYYIIPFKDMASPIFELNSYVKIKGSNVIGRISVIMSPMPMPIPIPTSTLMSSPRQSSSSTSSSRQSISTSTSTSTPTKKRSKASKASTPSSKASTSSSEVEAYFIRNIYHEHKRLSEKRPVWWFPHELEQVFPNSINMADRKLYINTDDTIYLVKNRKRHLPH